MISEELSCLETASFIIDMHHSGLCEVPGMSVNKFKNLSIKCTCIVLLK